MRNLFSMSQLMEADHCEDGLDRLMQANPGENVTLDDFKHCITSDLLWCLKLLPISDHDQKMIAVKTAVYAAELVAHLTDNPNAARCLDAARAWVDNPSEETRRAAARAWAAEAAEAAATWAAARAARAWAAAWAERAEEEAVYADPTTEPKIKSYLIQLIREQS